MILRSRKSIKRVAQDDITVVVALVVFSRKTSAKDQKVAAVIIK